MKLKLQNIKVELLKLLETEAVTSKRTAAVKLGRRYQDVLEVFEDLEGDWVVIKDSRGRYRRDSYDYQCERAKEAIERFPYLGMMEHCIRSSLDFDVWSKWEQSGVVRLEEDGGYTWVGEVKSSGQQVKKEGSQELWEGSGAGIYDTSS